MSDVRLTATNPVNSTVVPVACNDKGELLTVVSGIETIPNPLTVEGSITSEYVSSLDPSVTYKTALNTPDGQVLTSYLNDSPVIQFASNGYANFDRRSSGPPWGAVQLNVSQTALRVNNYDGTIPWILKYDGTVIGPSVLISTGAEDPKNYATVERDGEAATEYVGPVINVREELELLRAQVNELMDRLQMTPEGS